MSINSCVCVCVCVVCVCVSTGSHALCLYFPNVAVISEEYLSIVPALDSSEMPCL